MRTRTIHHIEDQPEDVLWLPGALENRYGLDHPDWLVSDSAETDDRRSTFFLNVDGLEWTIRHLIYDSADAFETEFAAEAQVGDIAIVDLMLGGNEDAIKKGYKVYEAAVERLGTENVYVLTSYDQIFNREIDPLLLIAKPPDVTILLSRIVGRLVLK